MTARLVTRLAGVRALVELVPTGIGPTVWAGQLRGAGVHGDTEAAAPTADGLARVLTRLTAQARRAQLRVVA